MPNHSPKLLYILVYRALNQYRIRNLTLTLQWLLKVKSQMTSMTFDIVVVEQDAVSKLSTLPDGVKHLFVHNKGSFSRGWGFNVAVTTYPDYNYYAFGDGDLIIPDTQSFVDECFIHCLSDPKPAFRPFRTVFDTSQGDFVDVDVVGHLIDKYNNNKLKLTERQGLTFSGGILILSNQMYELIGGWDENFTGWGREDDFMKIKLVTVGKCREIMSNLISIHIWHPITSDFSLKTETIELFNRYSQFNSIELQNQIVNGRLDLGNPHKYEK
jgi:hypothetical protein